MNQALLLAESGFVVTFSQELIWQLPIDRTIIRIPALITQRKGLVQTPKKGRNMQILFAVFMTLNSLVLGTKLDHMFTLHYVDSDALQPDRTIVVGYVQYKS